MYHRLNITLPAELLTQVDAFAHRERFTRSGLIAEALEAYVTGATRAPGSSGASSAAEATATYSTTRPSVDGWALERIGELARAFFSARDDVEAAWVFGSVAAGTAGPHSDVDLAVLPSDRTEPEARWELKLELTSRLPGVFRVPEVDVVVLPDVSALLGHRALVRGVRVYGERSRAAAEAEIRAANAYWDLEPVRRLSEARFSERVRAYGPDRP